MLSELPRVLASRRAESFRVCKLLKEFEGELKAARSAGGPPLGRFRCGRPVETRIDLDGVEVLSVERELIEFAACARAALCAGRVEHPVPGSLPRWVTP